MSNTEETELELPELQQADLEGDALRVYLNDVLNLGKDVTCLYRQEMRGQNLVMSEPFELVEMLSLGQVACVRLNYLFEGKRWLDTLMKKVAGCSHTSADATYRLVRMLQA